MLTTSNALKTSLPVHTISLKDGTELRIRKLQPADREKIREFFSQLSSASKYNRYFNHKDELTESELQNCVNSSPEEHYVIGAWAYKSGQEEELVGTASFIQLKDSANSAEFAIIIADEWQNKGIGKHLTRAVLDAAKDVGVERILVFFLPSNSGMKKLTQSMMDDVSFKYDEGMVVADVNLEKDEVTTLFWPSEVSGFWDDIFQAAIDMSFMPFTVYLNLRAEKMAMMMDTLTQYHHISDFENWLDSIDEEWF